MARLDIKKIKHKSQRLHATPKLLRHVVARNRVTYSSFMKGVVPSGKPFTFLSLFSGAGVGDYGLVLAGGRCVGACEIDSHRSAVHRHNIDAPLWRDIRESAEHIKRVFCSNPPDIIIATPPCQSFSTANSQRGNRTDHTHALNDARNRLFFDALSVIAAIRPKAVIFENVPNFLERVVQSDCAAPTVGKVSGFIEDALKDYVGKVNITCFSSLGVPQRRKRATAIYIRRDLVSDEQSVLALLEPSRWAGRVIRAPRTIESALRGMSSLDGRNAAAASDPNDFLHSVPVYKSQHYEWISSIPAYSGLSAWENRCRSCGGRKRTAAGLIVCSKCGDIIESRPHIKKDGVCRPIKGFKTSYKRVRADEVAPTVTTASGHFSSDLKLHFKENRVFSARECSILQSIPQTFEWPHEQRFRRNYLVREMIGEAIPPLVTFRLGLTLSNLINSRVSVKGK